MHIALVIYGDLATTSGGYLYDRMLVQHLRSAGAEVEVISIPWRNYPRHLLDNLSQELLERHIPGNCYDLILQDELNHPSLFMLNRRLHRRDGDLPIISIVHHLRSDEQHPPLQRALYRMVENRYLRSGDGFIFNSNTTRSRVHWHRGGSADGITAYPAADHLAPPPVQEVNASIRARQDGKQPLQILFVGNVIPRKGLHTLFTALASYTPIEYHVHIAGSLNTDPAYARKIQQSLRVLGLEQKSTMYGGVTTEKLRALYQDCDVLAVPSYEGFGIVYLEAMSYGLPVIATTAGAAHEIVENRVNGFLMPPGDASAIGGALTQLAEDREALATMGMAARNRYDRHPTWRTTFSQAQAWLWELSRRVH